MVNVARRMDLIAGINKYLSTRDFIESQSCICPTLQISEEISCCMLVKKAEVGETEIAGKRKSGSVGKRDGWGDAGLWKVHITHRHTSNISNTFVGNRIVDHEDVVGAPPVGAAPTTSSFST